MNLLYLSDVFCPWCYGFGPVMRRILADYPGTSVRVLGGDLVDEARNTPPSGSFSPVWKQLPDNPQAHF